MEGDNLKRRIIYFLLYGFLALIIFNSLLTSFKFDYNNYLFNIGKTDTSEEFAVTTKNLTNQQIYDVFKAVSKKDAANFFATNIETKDNKAIKTRYVYLNSDVDFDNSYLVKGKMLSVLDTESDKFLSTIDSNNQNEIGQLASMGSDDYEIRTFKSGLDKNLFNKKL